MHGLPCVQSEAESQLAAGTPGHVAHVTWSHGCCRVKEQAEAVEYKLGLKRKLRIFAEDTQRRLPQVLPLSASGEPQACSAVLADDF